VEDPSAVLTPLYATHHQIKRIERATGKKCKSNLTYIEAVDAITGIEARWVEKKWPKR